MYKSDSAFLMLKNRLAAVALILGGTLTTSCFSAKMQPDPGDPDYPQLNSHPLRPIAIYGLLDQSLTLRMIVTYSMKSSRKDCLFSSGIDDRQTGGKSVSDYLVVHPEDGRYRVVINADKFSPGKCGWDLTRAQASLMKGSIGSNGDAFFYGKPPSITKESDWINSNANPVEWVCNPTRLGTLACGARMGRKEAQIGIPPDGIQMNIGWSSRTI